MEPEGALPCSQEPSRGPDGFFLFAFPTKLLLYIPLISILARCPAHHYTVFFNVLLFRRTAVKVRVFSSAPSYKAIDARLNTIEYILPKEY